MKVYLILLGIAFSLIFLSCSNTTSSQEGYLTINNYSNGTATVSVANGHSVTIQAHSHSTLTVDTGKSVTAHISYSGEYIDNGNDTIEIATDHTSIYDLYADCGRLRINNNSDNTLYITFNGKSSISLDSNSYDTFRVSLPDGESGHTSFDYEGLYVFSDNATIPINSDELSTFTASADGGAIKINNNSSYSIQNIYFSPVSSSSWGADVLNGNLYNGNSAIWTVGHGDWDIKVVDDYGDAYFIYDEHVNINQTLDINFFDKKSSEWNKNDKKQTGEGSFQSAVQFIVDNQ